MTSTTSSKSKFKQGLSFFLWSLFTGKTAMIIYLSILTFFCSVIYIFALGISLQAGTAEKEVWVGASYFTIFFTMLLGFVFTFVFSIKEFSYLHDKRKTDMFGALPASRRTIFFSKLAAVVVQSAVPVILVMTFLAIMNGGTLTNYFGMSGIFGVVEGEIPDKNLWYMMLEAVVGVIANAVFLGFLSICCGKTSDKILSYLIINAAYPISALFVQLLPGSFIIGYSVDINEFFTCALSPYTAIWSINPAYWGGFVVLFGALCFVLLPRRKAECAQSHFAFKAPLIITKVIVSFAAGMVVAYFFGIIFSAVNADKPAFIIGWLMGSFIAYFVFQIIFAKGFKRFGWGMIPYGALVLFFAALMLVLSTGLFGYESYVPRVDEIESVSLVGDDVMYGVKAADGKITDKKQIEECIKGHQEAIELLKKQNPSFSTMTFGQGLLYDNYSIINSDYLLFRYKLKNGTTVSRDYGMVDGGDIDFINSETYLYNTSALFLIDPKLCTDIYISSDYDEEHYEDYNEYDEDETRTLILIDGEEYAVDNDALNTRENIIKLIEALKKDIVTYGKGKGTTVCELELEYISVDSHTSEYEDVIVESNYKNTLSFLKSISEKTKASSKATTI